jgi:hypothetical protein
MSRVSTRDAVLFVVLVGVAVASRLLPHAPNFTALMAVGLLAAVVFRSRILAAATPLAAMVISDAVIGGYDARLMLAVYGAMLLPMAMAWMVRGSTGGMRLVRVGAASVVCSVLFFAITNGAVWAFGSMYEPSAAGLGACFVAAVPFFKYQLAGDLSYGLGLFAAAAAWPRVAGALGRAPVPGLPAGASSAHA